MAVSVLIRRTFNDSKKEARLAPLIVKLRSLATMQPGYITGTDFPLPGLLRGIPGHQYLEQFRGLEPLVKQ